MNNKVKQAHPTARSRVLVKCGLILVAGSVFFVAAIISTRQEHNEQARVPATQTEALGGAGGGTSRTGKPAEHQVSGTRTASTNNGKAISQSSGGGGKRKSSITPTDSANMENAVRNALSNNSTNEIATLLKELRREPQGHATAIIALATDDSLPSSVRGMVVKLLGGMNDNASLQALVGLSSQTDQVALRAESLKALGIRQEAEAEARLREIATFTSDPARAMATSLLGSSRSEDSRTVLLTQSGWDESSGEELRNAALYSLRRFPDQEVVQTLLATANDSSETARIRATALYSLGTIGNSNAVPVIQANLNSQEREVRYSAALASQRVSSPEITAQLVGQLCDSENYLHVRKAASAALGRYASAADLAALRTAAEQTDGFGLVLAAEVFATRKDRQAVAFLQRALAGSADGYVTEKLQDALDHLQGGSQ